MCDPTTIREAHGDIIHGINLNAAIRRKASEGCLFRYFCFHKKNTGIVTVIQYKTEPRSSKTSNALTDWND